MTPVVTYVVYLVVSVALTVWVGRTLHKNGRVFLVDVFKDEPLADSVNHMLLVGFYLINFGYVTMNLQMDRVVADAKQSIEALSTKVGWVLLVLGGMHFLNLYVFSRMRRHARLESAPPPVEPDGFIVTRDPVLSR
jgi:hypothetical protein